MAKKSSVFNVFWIFHSSQWLEYAVRDISLFFHNKEWGYSESPEVESHSDVSHRSVDRSPYGRGVEG